MRWGYFFIGPAIIGLFCFNFGPMLFSLGISFTSWDVITPKNLSDWTNHKNLFQDPLVIKALKVTAYLYVVYGSAGNLHSIADRNTFEYKGKRNVRISNDFLCSVHRSSSGKLRDLDVYLQPRGGLLNSIIRCIGLLVSQFYLQYRWWSLPSLAIMAVWAAGNTVVIYLAGLQGVPRQSV